MKVYKRKINGAPSQSWYVRWKNHVSGRFIEWSAYTDKGASEMLGKSLESLSSSVAMGIPLDPAISKKIDALPANKMEKLVKMGLIKKARIRSNESLDSLIERFRLEKVISSSPEFAGNVATILRECADLNSWKSTRDITRSSINCWLSHLTSKKSRAPRTIQRHIWTLRAFAKWLSEEGHDVENLDGLRGPKVIPTVRRRMLLPDEWRWLVKCQHLFEPMFGLGGDDRILLYALAIQTGLRAGELASLLVGDFNLNAIPPNVVCRANMTKNAKPARQLFDESLAAQLETKFKDKLNSDKAFRISRHARFAEMIVADLAIARSEWMEAEMRRGSGEKAAKSDFLLAENKAGETLQFHSLRHTCGAWLAQAGAHPKAIQSIMRHSKITLTMDTYGHLFPDEQARTVGLFTRFMHGAQYSDNKTAEGG